MRWYFWSFGFVLDIDHHQQSSDDTHSYFHSIGQPHSHSSDISDISETSAVIDYSEDAVDHINSEQDYASVYVVEVIRTLEYSSVPDKVFATPLPDWQTPFLKHSPPPPKVS